MRKYLNLRFSLLPGRMILTLAAAFIAISTFPTGSAAQSLFSPAITVNGEIITYFELEQRARLLRVLRAPSNPDQLAREQLVEDKLKLQAAENAGIDIDPVAVDDGIQAFAERANLEVEQLLEGLASEGIAAETLRDFIRSNVGWRDYARARFLSQARPTEAEVARALGSGGTGGGLRVLLSEIIIPVNQQNAAAVQAKAEELSQITSTAEFSDAARQFSAAQTRDNGGRLDWMALTDLPPGLRASILELTPGEATAPISLQNAVAVFQMRDIQEIVGSAPRYSAIEYVTYALSGGRSAQTLAQAREIVARADTCDDFYGIAQEQPAEVLNRETKAPGDIPKDIALELAKLDEGEISTTLTRNDGTVLLMVMLCGRTAALNEDASPEDVANALTEQRMTALADSHLDQLRAEAVIIEK